MSVLHRETRFRDAAGFSCSHWHIARRRSGPVASWIDAVRILGWPPASFRQKRAADSLARWSPKRTVKSEVSPTNNTEPSWASTWYKPPLAEPLFEVGPDVVVQFFAAENFGVDGSGSSAPGWCSRAVVAHDRSWVAHQRRVKGSASAACSNASRSNSSSNFGSVKISSKLCSG